jgi:hypothetical protein
MSNSMWFEEERAESPFAEHGEPDTSFRSDAAPPILSRVLLAGVASGAAHVELASPFVDDGKPSDYAGSTLLAQRLSGGARASRRSPSPPARRQSSHETALQKSGHALDGDLKGIARALRETVPTLKSKADEVEQWDPHIQEKKEQVSAAAKHQQWRERDRLLRELSELEGKRAMLIAPVRDVFLARALRKAKLALKDVLAGAEIAGVHDDLHISDGVSVVSAVVGQVRAVAERFELGQMGELLELEHLLAQAFAGKPGRDKLSRLPVSPEDLEELDDVSDPFEVEAASGHLDAARAEASFARVAIRKWLRGEGGDHASLDDSIHAIDLHLGKAIEIVAQMPPGKRQTLGKALVAAEKEVAAVHQMAKMGPDGASPLGSLGMLVGTFDDDLARLRQLIGSRHR